MPLRACFLDVDGVILDPTRTHLEWVRLMGDVLAPALGREPVDWGRANAEVFPRVWNGPREVWHDEDPLIAARQLSLLLLHEACRLLDVPLPDEETAAALSRGVDRYVYQNTRAAFPGAASAIRTLATSYRPAFGGRGTRVAFGPSSAGEASRLRPRGARRKRPRRAHRHTNCSRRRSA